jgi:hypothetical protein
LTFCNSVKCETEVSGEGDIAQQLLEIVFGTGEAHSTLHSTESETGLQIGLESFLDRLDGRFGRA